MGNEVSAGEGEQEETEAEEEEEEEEEEDWTSREDTEASGGLWSLSHELEDDREVCVFKCSATSASQRQLCQAGADVSCSSDRGRYVLHNDDITPSIYVYCVIQTYSSFLATTSTWVL